MSSNKLPALAYRPAAQERELTGKLIASTSADEREALGQKLLDNICRSLKIPRTRLRVFEKRQPHKLRGGKLAYKLYGTYNCETAVIEIANLTSVRKQVVAGKTFLDTLIHELMHHIDRKFLRIPSTPHSPGFYKRIEDLKTKLMRMKSGERVPPQEAAWERPRDLTAALEAAAANARGKNDSQDRQQTNEAIAEDVRPETRKSRLSPQDETESLFPAPPGEPSAAKPRKKPPRAREGVSTPPKNPQKVASGEKEPQLSFDY